MAGVKNTFRLLISVFAFCLGQIAFAQTTDPFASHLAYDWQINQIDSSNALYFNWVCHVLPTTDSVMIGDGMNTGCPRIIPLDSATLQIDRTGTYPTLKALIPAVVPRSSSVRTSYTYGTAVQLSTTRDAEVYVSQSITCTLSLTTGTEGKIILEVSPNGSTGWVTVAEGSSSNTGSLAIAINTSQKGSVNLSGFVPASYYYRLATTNVTGTPTFTYGRAQEILL